MSYGINQCNREHETMGKELRIDASLEFPSPFNPCKLHFPSHRQVNLAAEYAELHAKTAYTYRFIYRAARFFSYCVCARSTGAKQNTGLTERYRRNLCCSFFSRCRVSVRFDITLTALAIDIPNCQLRSLASLSLPFWLWRQRPRYPVWDPRKMR